MPEMHPGQSSFAHNSSFTSGCMSTQQARIGQGNFRHTIGYENSEVDPSSFINRQESNELASGGTFEMGPISSTSSPIKQETHTRHTFAASHVPNESKGIRITSTSKIASKQIESA